MTYKNLLDKPSRICYDASIKSNKEEIMCNPESVIEPCMLTDCPHHVSYGINIGWHARPWVFRSTNVSEAFKNCMCLVRYDDGMSLGAIGDMFGVSAQAILDIQDRALQKIRDAADSPEEQDMD